MPRPSLVIGHSTWVIPRRQRHGGRALRSLGEGGFALLITITLLSFLVLLLVSLATLTRVETQVATNNQSIAQARQNALLALNLALGQLQKHAGPDQRVTARADVTIPSAVSVLAGTTTSAALTSIDTHWRARRNRQWTGVWLNSNNNPAAYDPNTPVAFNAVPALQSWLVSGNEKTADFTPETQLTGLSVTSSAADDTITDANGVTHRLLVSARTTGATSNATDLDRLVTAPQRTITATGVPGTDGSAATIGHYAWWVGDEGVKARANLIDTHAAGPSGETPAEKLAREAARRQSAQRPAIEAMTTNGTDGLASTYPANAPGLLKVFTPSQLSYLNSSAATFPGELKTRYHDLSVSSRGVLADVKNGGLKADLTYLFGQPDLTAFRTALRAHFGTNDIAPLNPDPAVATQLANPLINPVASLRATFPTTVQDNGNYTTLAKFRHTATWEQLWSFANQGSAFNNAVPPQAIPRLQTGTQHGLNPILIQTKLFYRLRVIGGIADADGTNRTGMLAVDVLPLFVLANPYSVPLAASDYQVRITGSNPQMVYGSIDPLSAATPSPDDDFNTPAYSSNAPTYAGNITYVLRTTGMAAGEAQIFTIDPDPGLNTTIDGDDRIRVTSSTDNKRVYLKNEFDPTPALTFTTDRRIPADKTHAALRANKTALFTYLYQGFTPGDAQGVLKLLQYTTAQSLTTDSEYASGDLYTFMVDPLSDGIRQGGGVNAVINQPPTTDHPAATIGSASTLFSHYQAPFLQVNYRTNQLTWTGWAGNAYHPLEWARRFTKNGSTGSAGNTPNPWFSANLMRPSGSTTTVRWGIVNIGEGQNQTVPPASIGGASASDVGFINHLYDIPRPGQPLVSLGQLQHFNTMGYHPLTSTPDYTTSMSSFLTNYPLSNSYTQPRVPRDQVYYYVNHGNISYYYQFDGSYIWNDIFWDRFTFSTYPQTGNFDFANGKLVNARYRPFRDLATTPWDDETKFRGDGNPATAANTRTAAANLLVDGAFNINSTSVEAWKAVFSSLKNVPVGTAATPSAPFSRTLAPAGGSTDAATATSPNSWAGFRDLDTPDIQALAEAMVMQIRKRGPFLSLSDFVNRKLIRGADDTFDLGLSGALQTALDATINQTSRIAPAFRVRSSAPHATDPVRVCFEDMEYILPSAIAGFPGYVLQGDVLSSLGSSITARSDTFTIRTYGDATNPATGAVTGRAWCEAVVQRIPDYVDPAANVATATPAAGTPNATFGRRFQIVSFRWLSPDDV